MGYDRYSMTYESRYLKKKTVHPLLKKKNILNYLFQDNCRSTYTAGYWKAHREIQRGGPMRPYPAVSPPKRRCSVTECSDIDAVKLQDTSVPNTALLSMHPPHSHIRPLFVWPWHHPSRLHSCSFVTSRMLYKRNHAICNLLGLGLFSPHNSLRVHPGVPAVHSFWLLSTVPQHRCTTVYQSVAGGHLGHLHWRLF